MQSIFGAALSLLALNVAVVSGQKCADGVDAFVECEGVCKSDPSLNCEIINGKGYCCGYGTTTAAPQQPTQPGGGGGGGSGGGGSCKDVVPDECKRKSFLCSPQNYQYVRLMKKYCSLTCSYCQPQQQQRQPAQNNAPKPQPKPPAQQQQAKPAVSGCSDKNTKCAQQSSLCNQPVGVRSCVMARVMRVPQ
ncbi:unnamed protein product [Bursaphelenchus xylophilus]|uniref:(pine wood nematode) hypothetical protein n=1 Tax=Bursaphelenchus xylophilus TaxID=6326 RepID=A0A7I8WPG0_BURXY|nr:unnamed protein product [Bursaphelenchus xylophilus]CAG9094641.1 unnamed protein product [Bursaphelenchus xylophilus]